MRRRLGLPCLAAALIFVLSGCAFMNRDNTRAFNLVEDNLWPESDAVRAAVFPVVFPVGLVAITVDAVVIHPATVVGDAFGDTTDALWDNWDWDEHYVTECATLPWRGLVSPIFFTGALLGRSMFDIPKRAEAERKKAEAEAKKADKRKALDEKLATARSATEAARALLDDGDARAALERALPGYGMLKDANLRPPELTVARDLGLVILKAAAAAGRHDVLLDHRLVSKLLISPWDDAVAAAVDDLAKSPGDITRWCALNIQRRALSRMKMDQQVTVLRRGLSDENPLVRERTVGMLHARRNQKGMRRLLPDLKRMADGDANAILRLRAAAVIRAFK